MDWCPYPQCGYGGTTREVDDHRASGIHNAEPQAGSNLAQRPRDVATWRDRLTKES
jgi:hypothetical protein